MPRLLPCLVLILLVCLPLTACAPMDGDVQPKASLVNTYWKLLSVDGRAVSVADNQREPHVVLHLEDRRVAGFAGCNHLMGQYRSDGAELRFEDVGSTLMACEQGMYIEAAFLLALRDTASWRIVGERLELFDAQGKSLATFESVYLR